MIPEFKPFQKIPRLMRDIVITEKIDGTNAIVHIDETGTILTPGSRSRWLYDDAPDNMGFGAWARENETELLKLGPGYHYGEWWGAGIQRRYNQDRKRFSLFNVGRWAGASDLPACCDVVPALYVGPNDDDRIDDVLVELKRSGSAAAPGFMDPEGIVIYHTAGRTLFKYTFDGDGHKGG